MLLVSWYLFQLLCHSTVSPVSQHGDAIRIGGTDIAIGNKSLMFVNYNLVGLVKLAVY